MNPSIKIDPEFSALIPPLSDEERELLEQNLLEHGCRDPLVIWPQPEGSAILIDGHNRYAICTRHELPYRLYAIEAATREEVKRWIILNQFARRNISAYQRAALALVLEEMIAEKAREKQESTQFGAEFLDDTVFQNSGRPLHTDRELANIAGVSHDTIHKVRTIQAEAPVDVQDAAKQGDVSVHRAYQITKELRDAPEAGREAEAQRLIAESNRAIDRRKKLATQVYNAIDTPYCEHQ